MVKHQREFIQIVPFCTFNLCASDSEDHHSWHLNNLRICPGCRAFTGLHLPFLGTPPSCTTGIAMVVGPKQMINGLSQVLVMRFHDVHSAFVDPFQSLANCHDVRVSRAASHWCVIFVENTAATFPQALNLLCPFKCGNGQAGHPGRLGQGQRASPLCSLGRIP